MKKYILFLMLVLFITLSCQSRYEFVDHPNTPGGEHPGEYDNYLRDIKYQKICTKAEMRLLELNRLRGWNQNHQKWLGPKDCLEVTPTPVVPIIHPTPELGCEIRDTQYGRGMVWFDLSLPCPYLQGRSCPGDESCPNTYTDTQEVRATPTFTVVPSTETPIPLPTITPSPTMTPTKIPVQETPPPIPTVTLVPVTATVVVTLVPTLLPTETPKPPTVSPVPTVTVTNTPTSTPRPTFTRIPTVTKTPTMVATITPTSTLIPTHTPTSIPRPTFTRIPTPTSTLIPTITPTNTNTPIPTSIIVRKPTELPTMVPTSTTLPTQTAVPIPTMIPTNTPIATATSTKIPTATNTPIATATSTKIPTATNTPIATATSTKIPTATNTPIATSTPNPIIGTACGLVEHSDEIHGAHTHSMTLKLRRGRIVCVANPDHDATPVPLPPVVTPEIINAKIGDICGRYRHIIHGTHPNGEFGSHWHPVRILGFAPGGIEICGESSDVHPHGS